MVKIQARKEKNIGDSSSFQCDTWDVWVDTTVRTTYIRNYEKTDRVAYGLPKDHADKIVKEINSESEDMSKQKSDQTWAENTINSIKAILDSERA